MGAKNKGINLSAMVLSEEDKKKAEELAKPKPELTPEQREERKEAKKERRNKNIVLKKNYKVVMFKLKGHQTWRISMDSGMMGVKNITEQKIIEIDVITGEVKVY
jgi:hypothetical protein